MDTLIRVELPLPLDVSSTLLRAVGAAYPNAKIVTEGGGRHMTLAISEEDRAAGDQLDPEDVIKVPSDEDIEAHFSSLRDGSFGMTLPEWFTTMMVGALSEMLEDTDAENYLEYNLQSDHKTYAMVVCKTDGRTPHSLRKDAEARAEKYAQALRDRGVDPDTL